MKHKAEITLILNEKEAEVLGIVVGKLSWDMERKYGIDAEGSEFLEKLYRLLTSSEERAEW